MLVLSELERAASDPEQPFVSADRQSMCQYLDGVVSIIAGDYFWLIATGKAGKKSDDTSQKNWFQKNTGFTKAACVLLIIFGVLRLTILN